jgi:undecaprenyl diphosphate synthase
MEYFSSIDTSKVPNHIAIIMDGNGRWAKEQGKDRVVGHYEGVNSVRATVEACAKIGVKFLTLYAFSTENWNRPKYEVDALMELLVSALRGEVNALKQNNVRLRVIGDIASLPPKCQDQLKESIAMLDDCTGITLILALSYSAKWEIKEMVKKLALACKNNILNIEDINDEVIAHNLSTAEFPDPELLIRTGGEQRISNFLLYQIAYAELYFSDIHWPEFKQEQLYKAVYDYQNRERRFGMTSEQIQNKV